MDLAKKHTALIYIEAQKAFFYTVKTKNTLKIDFPSDVVSDLEIMDKEKLVQILETFLKNNFKGINFEIILVFSKSVTFEKDFPLSSYKDNATEANNFLDMVPFEETLSKTYKLSKKTKVIAINKALFDSIKSVIDRNNHITTLALPYSILEEMYPELTKKVDLGFLAEKADSFKQYTIIDTTYVSQQDLGESEKTKKDNKNLIALVLVFIILFVVLIAFAYMTFFAQEKPVVKQKAVSTPKIKSESKEDSKSASKSGNLTGSTSATLTPTNFVTPFDNP